MEEIKVDNPEDQKAEDVLDQYEQSAAMFNHLSRIFRKKVYLLANRKKRAIVRVLEAVLFKPLEDVEVIGKEEKNLLDLCGQIIYHKAKLIEYANIRQQEKNKEGEMNESEK